MKYREIFEEISAPDSLRQRVKQISAAERRETGRRRIPKGALIAAVFAVVLTGSTLAAVGLPGSIPTWFAARWEEVSDEQMSEEQTMLIESLTQEVGVSDTSHGVTVTLDSVTVGDSTLWLLLRAEGDLSVPEEAELCHFGRAKAEFRFSPDREKTPGGYTVDYGFVEETEEGGLIFLMRQSFTLTGENSLTEGYDGVLRLDDLMWNDSTVVEGTWKLPFTISPVEREVLILESAVVPVVDREADRKELAVELKEIRVTSTDIRFVQEAETAELYPAFDGVVLEDGTEIGCAGGGSRWVGELYTGQWASNYYWSLPVETEQIAGLRFGDTLIPVE